MKKSLILTNNSENLLLEVGPLPEYSLTITSLVHYLLFGVLLPVTKIQHLRIRVVFVIGPLDTTQNFVFDGETVHVGISHTRSRGS